MPETDSSNSSAPTGAIPSVREIMLYGVHRITVLVPVSESDDVHAQWIRLSSVAWTPCDSFADVVAEVLHGFLAVCSAAEDSHAGSALTVREGLGLVADSQGLLRYWCDPESGVLWHIGFDPDLPTDLWHMRTLSLDKDEISLGRKFATTKPDLWAAGQPLFS